MGNGLKMDNRLWIGIWICIWLIWTWVELVLMFLYLCWFLLKRNGLTLNWTIMSHKKKILIIDLNSKINLNYHKIYLKKIINDFQNQFGKKMVKWYIKLIWISKINFNLQNQPWIEINEDFKNRFQILEFIWN